MGSRNILLSLVLLKLTSVCVSTVDIVHDRYIQNFLGNITAKNILKISVHLLKLR